jgi:hypothetical protein
MSKFPSPDEEAPDGCPEAEAFADKQARRYALERFGHYAAAAPTVMLRLAARAGRVLVRHPRMCLLTPNIRISTPVATTRI